MILLLGDELFRKTEELLSSFDWFEGVVLGIRDFKSKFCVRCLIDGESKRTE